MQLCDAPLTAPAEALIIQEAREGRLLPGQGQLPLAALMGALPTDVQVSVETPSVTLRGENRLKQVREATHGWLGNVRLPTNRQPQIKD
ncbi:hypothetical protein D3C73_1527290 [compost metagenome]